MEDTKIYNSLEKVAHREGISLAEAVFEIESAISVAYQNAKHSNDITRIKLWYEIPSKGDIPAAVELINYISNRVLENNENQL